MYLRFNFRSAVSFSSPFTVAMAFIGDTTPIKLQLKFTNYAETLDRSKPRHHVRRISFIITILEDELCGGDDDVVDYAKPFSAEDRQVLKWQAMTENLQDDVEVRTDLTYLSGRLCPYKNIGLSLYDKVTDHDTQQQTIGQRPLSSYRHVSFRSAMLTKHSAADGQIQLLYSDDGLPLDRSCLRWRSHDYIKLVFPEARPSAYRVFWLVQWDVVDMSDLIIDGHDAISPGRGINCPRPCLDHPASERQAAEVSGKLYGVRHRENRKSPWIAEVRPKGSRDKISLGSYQTREAAARAVDAGSYYYDMNRFNFRDSLWYLEEIPGGLNEKEKEAFVKAQAHRLSKKPPWIPESQYYNRDTDGFTSSSQPWNIGSGNSSYGSSSNFQPATNANCGGLPTPYGSFETPSIDSGRDLQTNLHVRPSTSFGSNVFRETVGSSPEENLWMSTSIDSVRTAVSELERADMYEPLLTPAVSNWSNCTSGEATNDVFNVFTYSPMWDESSEMDISDDMGRADSPTDITSVGVPDSNDWRLHRGRTTLAASHGPYDSSLLIAQSEQAEPSGDYGRDMDLYPDWLLS